MTMPPDSDDWKLARDEIIRAKDLFKVFFKNMVESYRNRNDPDWGITRHSNDSITAEWRFGGKTIKAFNRTAEELMNLFGAGSILCHKSIYSSPIDNENKIEKQHDYNYIEIIERSNDGTLLTILYECTRCGLYRLEEKSSQWQNDIEQEVQQYHG